MSVVIRRHGKYLQFRSREPVFVGELVASESASDHVVQDCDRLHCGSPNRAELSEREQGIPIVRGLAQQVHGARNPHFPVPNVIKIDAEQVL